MISDEIKRIFDLLRQKIWEKRLIEMRWFHSLRYQIMMNCWQNEPKVRPSFTDLTKQLKDMENQHKVRLSLPSDKKIFQWHQPNAMTTIARLLTALRLCRRPGRDGFKVHFGTVFGDVFPHGGRFVLQNSSQCTLKPSQPGLPANRKVANRAYHFL